MKIVAIIPVKSTSERISSKNLKLLCNKPLFIYTLEKLLQIKEFDEIWIDTDSYNIIEIANDYGLYDFKHFIRDKKYANNSTNGNELLQNEMLHINADIYIQILCTSPFIKSKSIVQIINNIKKDENNSVIACFKEKIYTWKNNYPNYDTLHIPNSKDLEDTIIESMSIYAIKKEEFLLTKKRIGNSPLLYFLNDEEKIDINFPEDFELAKKIAFYHKFEEQSKFNHLKLNLNTCILSDILHDLGFPNQIIQNMKLNISQKKIFGRVRPIQIKQCKDNDNPDNIYNCLNSYENISYGDIIFVNNLIDKKAYFGDLNATISYIKGCQGTIVNGYTRDINRITELDYPLFYKDNTCSDVKNYGTLDFYDKSVTINNLKIHVNDLIFADIDGIVVIPRKIEKEVIEKCRNIMKNENNIYHSILDGNDIKDILDNFGAF